MTKETQTVWKDRQGDIIMRESAKGDYGAVRIIIGTGVTREQAEDLRDALNDFLAPKKEAA